MGASLNYLFIILKLLTRANHHDLINLQSARLMPGGARPSNQRRGPRAPERCSAPSHDAAAPPPWPRPASLARRSNGVAAAAAAC